MFYLVYSLGQVYCQHYLHLSSAILKTEEGFHETGLVFEMQF